MDELEVHERELMDEVGSLKFSPPPMKKSDTRDSISSVDSDVSPTFDRRGSKGEEADADFSDSGSSDLETTETSRIASINRVTSQAKLQTRRKPKSGVCNGETESESGAVIIDCSERPRSDVTDGEINVNVGNEITAVSDVTDRKKTDEEDEDLVAPCDDELAEKISAQVEFYFGDENIVKDAFLLKHVKRNKEGYVSLKLISSFKRVKHLSRDWRVVGAALRSKSTKLEVNEQGTKLRRRDPLPPYDQTVPSRTVLAARLPVDKLSIESVAELFGHCGEIALIRVLRPGNPAPSEVRQAIAKRPELANSEECALVEFTDSAAARAALGMSLGDARIYELQQSSGTDKKRKQQNQQSQQQKTQPQQQQPFAATKKSVHARIARENAYNSSSCASGSEAEDPRTARNGRQTRAHPVCHHVAFAPNNGHAFQGPPSPEAWLTRRLSSCSITGVDGTGNGIILRRLSSCSGSGSGSDTGSYSNRRFSSCSSASDNGGYAPAAVMYNPHLPHSGHHRNASQVYPTLGCYPQGRRFSCCSSSGSVPGSPTSGYGYGYEYSNPSGLLGQAGRRGSADCGPFLRRLSSCSRDSGFFDPNNRRSSSCSSSSDSCSGQFRSRSNSGFVLMAHLPENVTRMPSGPDGSRGFGRPIPTGTNDHRLDSSPSAAAVDTKCR